MVELVAEAKGRIEQAEECLQHLAALVNRGVGGREIALTQTKLQEAKMWLANTPLVVKTND